MTSIFTFVTLDLVRLFHGKLAVAGFIVTLFSIVFLLPAKKISYAQNSQLSDSSREIIVVFKNRPTVSLMSTLSNNTTQNLQIKNGITGTNALVFDVTTGNIQTAINELSRDPNVASVFPNYKWSLQAVPNDPLASSASPQSQWNLYKLNLAGTGTTAWDVTTGSGSVIVAVIDTGVQSNHPDLSGKISSLVDCSGSSCSTVNSMTDAAGSGHGTHVAGIIGASTNNGAGVAGVGYNTKLMIIKVYTSGPNNSLIASTDNFLNGIKWAADHGAKVINTSSGVVAESLDAAAIAEINSTIDYAWQRGAIVVAAAGNCGGNSTNIEGCGIHPVDNPNSISGWAANSKLYPAASPNVISVAATTLSDALAGYSEHNDASDPDIGNWIDVAAPGGDGTCSDSTKSCILSTVPTNNYFWDSGTSMASPEVAGVAALVWAKNPSLTKDQVKSIIETTANHNILAGTNNGLVNALAAVQAASGITGTPSPSPTGTNLSGTPVPSVTGGLSPTPSPTGNLTPTVAVSPTVTPTAGPTATPTLTPTPTITPYPTTGPARLPKTRAPNSPSFAAPYCPQTVSGVSYNSSANYFSFAKPVYAQTVTLTSTPTISASSCAKKSFGDANCDGTVNLSDFNLWLQEFDTMQPANPANQNANFACVEGNTQTYFVDLSSFEVWRRNTTTGLVSSSPQPGSPTITPGGPTITPCPTKIIGYSSEYYKTCYCYRSPGTVDNMYRSDSILCSSQECTVDPDFKDTGWCQTSECAQIPQYACQ